MHMTISENRIDFAAVILLCLAGLTFTLLIWVAGSPQYGVLSTLWRKPGIPMLVGCSLIAFILAACILRRLYCLEGPRPHGLLAFSVVTATPLVFFLYVLVARFFCGE